jgi:membrane-associated protease RseP (regulator of RpoE activity)
MEPWTDIIQAIAALIAIPGAIAAFIILFIRDKSRESEIKSLSTIAAQLTEMQIETEKRYKSSKKPLIMTKLTSDLKDGKITLEFLNSNSNTSITTLKVTGDVELYNIISFGINDLNGKQSSSVILAYKDKPFEFSVLHVDYTTEEGYTFIQDILIWFENGIYKYSPSVIIDQKNSPLENE